MHPARMARLILSRRLLRARFSREVVVQPTGVVVAAADEGKFRNVVPQQIEDMLKDTDATLVFVEHDRHFVEKIATDIIDMS